MCFCPGSSGSKKNRRAIEAKVGVNFGKRLRAIRKQKGLTQTDVADKFSRDYRFVGAIERGEQSPRLITCWYLAKSIGVPLSELMKF
ncbi:MAG: helix-turn-helix transcriptional regulator [Planctomycetes bacterium]|nr:helix-turn-helix transcriptional regulator [Planctomycetota bacterium]